MTSKPDPPQVRRLPSRSRSGLWHEVTRLDDGRLACSCEAASHGLACWHVAETCPSCLGGKRPDQEICDTCKALQQGELDL